MFHIVQPCANGPRRFEHATMVSSYRTSDDAFDELDRVKTVLETHGLTALASDLAVVNDDRLLIPARVQTIETTNVVEIRTRPTEGWDFFRRTLVEHVALVPCSDGRLEVWRLDADGMFSRMSAVERELGQLPRVAIVPPPLPRPALQQSVVAKTRARSFWSDYQVRVRWPKPARRHGRGSWNTGRDPALTSV